MKYKVLLIGRNKMLIGDFFMYLEEDFEMQTSSMRQSDISSHIHYFKPDVLVYCMNKEEKERTAVVASLKECVESNQVMLVLTGDLSECEAFKNASGMGDLIVKKPITARGIKEKVVEVLAEKEANRKAAEEAAEALVSVVEVEEAVPVLDVAQSILQASRPTVSVEELLRQAEEASKAAKAETVEKSEPVIADPSKKHILVVDDDPMLLKLIKEQLKDSYTVATAINGAVALKFLENKKTDLIILDYEMPNENGAEVLQKIRRNPAIAQLPVIFLTGVKDREKIKKLVDLKPQGYLLKPIEREKLLRNIKNLIG